MGGGGVSADYFSTHGSVLGCWFRIDGMGTITESSSESSFSPLSPSRSTASERGKAEEEVVSNCRRNISEQHYGSNNNTSAQDDSTTQSDVWIRRQRRAGQSGLVSERVRLVGLKPEQSCPTHRESSFQ